MKYRVELTTKDLQQLVVEHIGKTMAGAPRFSPNEVKIEVRSSQNYRVKEWETGEMRAVVDVELGVGAEGA